MIERPYFKRFFASPTLNPPAFGALDFSSPRIDESRHLQIIIKIGSNQNFPTWLERQKGNSMVGIGLQGGISLSATIGMGASNANPIKKEDRRES